MDKLILSLNTMPALCITGPRYVGKSYVANSLCEISFDLSELPETNAIFNVPYAVLNINKKPILIDEWQLNKEIWTVVKNIVDEKKEEGLFILTGSSWLGKGKVKDVGIGRFAYIKLMPLTLYEANLTDQSVSFLAVCQNTITKYVKSETTHDINEVIYKTFLGGFPTVLLSKDSNFYPIFYQNYWQGIYAFAKNNGVSLQKQNLETVLQYCALMVGQEYSLRSLTNKLEGQNEVGNFFDLLSSSKTRDDKLLNRNTIYKYFQILQDLYLINRLSVFNTNISSTDISLTKTDKLYFCDPALALSRLNWKPQLILDNLGTFGFYFENLVYKELKVYADYYNAQLYYFEKNNPKLEIDFIMQFADGSFVAIEAKTSNSANNINKATKQLLAYMQYCLKQKEEKCKQSNKYKWNINRQWAPKRLIIITGTGNEAYETKDGIYILPLLMLKP